MCPFPVCKCSSAQSQPDSNAVLLLTGRVMDDLLRPCLEGKKKSTLRGNIKLFASCAEVRAADGKSCLLGLQGEGKEEGDGEEGQLSLCPSVPPPQLALGAAFARNAVPF